MNLHPRRLGARSRPRVVALALVATLAVGTTPAIAQEPSPAGTDGRIGPFTDIPRYRVDERGTNVQPGSVPATMPSLVWSVALSDGVLMTPLLADGKVLVADQSGGIHALDAATGATAWTVDLEWEPTGAIVIDGVLVVGLGDPDGSFMGIDIGTGKIVWTTTGLGRVSGGGLARIGTEVVLGSDDGMLHALDATTGTQTQTWDAPAGVGSLAISDGVAYLGLLDGRTAALDLTDGSMLWPPVTLLSNLPSSIAVGEDHYYISSRQLPGDPASELLAIDRATGQVVWRFRSPSGRQVGPGSLQDGVLFVGSESGGLYALDALTGEVRWHAEEAPSIGAMVSYADGLVLASGLDGSLSAWDAADGDPVWTMALETTATTSAIASGGLVFQADEGGTVKAFGPTDAAPAVSPGPSIAASAPPSGSAPLTVVAEWDATHIAGLDQPCSGDVTAGGDLVLPNCLSGEILQVDAQGNVVRRTGSVGTKAGQFNFQRDPNDWGSAIGGAAVAPDGTIYVVDTVNRRVQHLAADLSVLGAFGSYGRQDGQFLEPIDIAVGPDGTVYVVDDVRDDIQRFTAAGKHLQTIGAHGTGPGQMNFTSGIDVGPDGTLLNADWDNNRIQAWTADGEFLWTLGKRGGGPGEFRNPVDILMTADGRIVVADFDGLRLQVFGPDLSWLGDLPLPDTENGWTVGGLAGGGEDGRIYAMRPFTDRILVLQLTPMD